MFLVLFGGFLMALADSVPGVSGGTIAFIIGIYDSFINSLNDIASKDKQKRIDAIKFLIKLGIGWITGMALAATVISSVFEEHIYALSSLFIGFILASIPLIVYEEKATIKGKKIQSLWILAGMALVIGITYLSTHNLAGLESLKWGSFSPAYAEYLFVVGALAISAMVLPGISGSTVMLIFGIYVAVISGVKGFLHLDMSYFGGLFIFGIGVLTGICTVVKLLRFLLTKHRAAIVYFIIGMMAASLYAVVMGPESSSLSEQKDALSFSTFSILWFIVGIAFIGGLQFLKLKFNKKS